MTTLREQLEAANTELARSRGFIRGADTQLTKALAVVAKALAMIDAGESPPVVEPTPSPTPSDGFVMPPNAEIRHAIEGQGIDLRSGGTVDKPLVILGGEAERTTVPWIKLRSGVSHVDLLGLRSLGLDGKSALDIVGAGNRDIGVIDCDLAERVRVQHFEPDGPKRMADVEFFRCIFRDAPHGQGIFVAGVDGLAFMDCLWDRNGYSDGHDPNDRNHNAYLMHCTDVVVDNFISSRASSFGFKISSDTPEGFSGLLIRNGIVVDCPNGITLGHSETRTPLSIEDVLIRDVVLTRLGGRIRQGLSPDGNWADQCFGVDFTSVKRATARDLLFSERKPFGSQPAMRVQSQYPNEGVGVQGLRFAGWGSDALALHPAVDHEDNLRVDLQATVDDYAAAHGYGDWSVLLEAARTRPRGEWREELSGRAISAWLRERNR